jgi:hypothetical protein
LRFDRPKSIYEASLLSHAKALIKINQKIVVTYDIELDE